MSNDNQANTPVTYVHRSYRCPQASQYLFDALCQIKGMQPSAMIVGLIEEWVAAESDPDTITAINAVALARIKQTASLSG